MKNCLNKWKKYCQENHFLNKVIFAKQINRIIRTPLKKYLQSIFLVKNILFKLIILLFFGIFVFGLCFGLRQYFIENMPAKIVVNRGVAFSTGSNWNPAAVYAVQSIPIIIAFFGFLLMPKWYFTIGFVLMFLGGMTNIIDRALSVPVSIVGRNGVSVALKDGVIDYFDAPNSIFNMADVFVIIGVCISVLSIIISVFKNDKPKNENCNQNNVLENHKFEQDESKTITK